MKYWSEFCTVVSVEGNLEIAGGFGGEVLVGVSPGSAMTASLLHYGGNDCYVSQGDKSTILNVFA